MKLMQKKITICYPFDGSKMGGSKISFLQFINKLDKKKFLPIIVLFNGGIFYEHLKTNNIPFEYLPNFKISEKNILLQIIKSFYLINFIKKHEIEIVHTNDNLMHLIWALPSKLTNKIFIKHFRNTDRSKLMILFELFTDKIIAISKYNRSLITKIFINKTVMIYNPIQLSKKKEITKYDKKLRNKFVITFVSNPIKLQKNPFILIEIAKELINKIDFKFLIIGSKDSIVGKEFEKEINSYNLGKYFVFTGRKFPIYNLLSLSNLLISPAKHEAFGRTVVEAMKLNIPVLASSEGGHKEIIKHNYNGLLCPTNSSKDYVKSILKLNNDGKLIKRLRRNAKLKANKKYSVKNHVEKIQNLYLTLTSNNRK